MIPSVTPLDKWNVTGIFNARMIPSEHRSSLLDVNNRLLRQIDNVFDIFGEDVANDATTIEFYSKLKKIEKPVVSSIEKQYTMTMNDIKTEFSIDPQWGEK